MSQNLRVLIVCMGNICRSPMAEGLLVHKVKAAGLHENIAVDSAGTGGWHEGELPDARTFNIAEKYGFTLPSRARQIRPRDVADHQYILVMDDNNHREVARIMQSRNSPAKLHYVREFDPQAQRPAPVPDPYNGSESDFENVYTILDRSLDVFLQHLRTEHGL